MTHTLRLATISGIFLALFLLFTNPERLSPIILTLPFVLIFATLLFGALFVFAQFGATGRVQKRAALLTAGVPVILLVLQSLGQLTIRDVLAICVLFVGVYFYMSRFGAQSVNR